MDQSPGADAAVEPLPALGQVAVTREVTFWHRGQRLRGLLHHPPTAGPWPAVAAIHGSGPGPAESFGSEGRILVPVGVAVLGWDKPGVGGSDGDWRTQDFADRASEALAAAAFLAEQPEVDADRIGLLGGSQGGWVAPLAGAQAPDRIRAVVSLSGPAVSPRAQEAHRIAGQLRDDRWDPDSVTAALEVFHQRLDRVIDGEPATAVHCELTAHPGWAALASALPEAEDPQLLAFIARIADFDPVPVLDELSCPALYVLGAEDAYVPVADSAARLEPALARLPGSRLEIIDGADHGLTVPGPDPATGRDRRPAPRAVQVQRRWVAEVLR